MVLPLASAAAAAARAAGTAGSAGATALGLQMGQADLELSKELFRHQLKQSKRLWTADHAQASIRHNEACWQAAQQHAEAQAMASATYFQAEKLARQGYQLSREQDARAYEMSWRAEVRECLRDELTNQNNRFQTIMLCDTVCLGCVFSLIADGSPPEETPQLANVIYLASLGLSITLFSISLWCGVIVVRRLHDHTAATLERKLFGQSEDLRQAWQHQLEENLPTGPAEIHMLNQAYDRWIDVHIDPLGRRSIHLLSMGVVAMFLTAGLLMHNRYLITYQAPIAVFIFWGFVIVMSVTVMWMKLVEDKNEKQKEGVYDVSWQDQTDDFRSGPFGKILQAAEQLWSPMALELANPDRAQALAQREALEQQYCAKTQSLHQRMQALQQRTQQHSQTRQEILSILTTAAEEIDFLPEELITKLTKILHDVDEGDHHTANTLAEPSDNMNSTTYEKSPFDNDSRSNQLVPMAPNPVDAQRIPVSLGSIRKKLGEIPLTTLVRIRNLSNEPLRLQSGLQLKGSGKYLQSLDALDCHGNVVCYHLHPIAMIPARTEVVLAARSQGNNWWATSGIKGEIVYTKRDDSWQFGIQFSNDLVKNVRKCSVSAVAKLETDEYWQISKDEVDRKANNEIVVSIDVQRGKTAKKAHEYSRVAWRKGYLLKQNSSGLKFQWQSRWFVLTPKVLVYSRDESGLVDSRTIHISDIRTVRVATDVKHRHAFELELLSPGVICRLAAPSVTERDDWVKELKRATRLHGSVREKRWLEQSSSSSSTTHEMDAVECVHDDEGTQVLPYETA